MKSARLHLEAGVSFKERLKFRENLPRIAFLERVSTRHSFSADDRASIQFLGHERAFLWRDSEK
jgi:hypothetical protein